MTYTRDDGTHDGRRARPGGEESLEELRVVLRFRL